MTEMHEHPPQHRTLVSLVIITRNEVDQVTRLASALSRNVTDVVIVDSSDPREHKDLQYGLSDIPNLTFRQGVALGYADPLRPYAYSLAHCETIFYLDSDEWPSPTLIRDLGQVVDRNEQVSAFLIRRVTIFRGRLVNHSLAPMDVRAATFDSLRHFTRPLPPSIRRDLQLRLFRKHDLHDTGTVHSAPTVSGSVKVLPRLYYLVERFSEATRRQTFIKYLKLEAVTRRFTYDDVCLKIGIEPLRKILLLHAHAQSLSQKDELSPSDYIRAHAFERFKRERDPAALVFPDSYARAKAATLMALPPEINRMLFECSSDVAACGGVIDYLGLRDAEHAASMVDCYPVPYQYPEDLTIELILDKFFSRHAQFGRRFSTQTVIAEMDAAALHGVSMLRGLTPA